MRPSQSKSKRNKPRNEEFLPLITALEVNDVSKIYLEDRWIILLTWMDKSAIVHKSIYYTIKIVIIIGGILIPSLIGSNNQEYRPYIFIIGIVIAILTAIDELFKYKEYWYHHRTGAEALRTEGWNFFQLSAFYQQFKTHQEAFPFFVERVEKTAQSSLELFKTRIMTEDKPQDKPQDKSQDT